MPIPTYTGELGEDLLGPSISVVRGRGIFDTTNEDDTALSIDTINAQLKGSRDSIEFLPSNSMIDEPFEVFKKNLANSIK